MTLLQRWLGRSAPGPDLAPLYAAIVAVARRPDWYRAGGVADTLDGRFDMLAAILSLVLLRLEALPGGTGTGARLTERFVADMDAQLREAGIGDVVVGKQVGRMMSALGGRLAAYRAAFAPGAAPAVLDEALARNVYRGDLPAPAAIARVARDLRDVQDRLAARSADELIGGRL